MPERLSGRANVVGFLWMVANARQQHRSQRGEALRTEHGDTIAI
jgi:hypothetical protein